MTARSVTYADLDAFLERLGLERRSFEVDHGITVGSPNGVDRTPRRRPVQDYAYGHAKTSAVLMLPIRPPDNVAMPHHLHAARRTMVDWDVISNVEFDLWLCQMRFLDVCAEPASAHGRARATG